MLEFAEKTHKFIREWILAKLSQDEKKRDKAKEIAKNIRIIYGGAIGLEVTVEEYKRMIKGTGQEKTANVVWTGRHNGDVITVTIRMDHHNTIFYISTETFYVEVRMDGEGAVLETKIHHQTVERSGAGSHHLEQAAPEISECLSKGDFAKFTEHLKGLMAVYAIPNCSALDKARAWQALYHLERDLERLGRQGWSQDLGQVIQRGSLGLVQARAGGVPMRLVYFLPPYELIKPETGSLMPLTASILKEGELGFSATLALRPSTDPYLLPLSSLVQGQDWSPLTKSNAVPMPAHPSLALDKPLPMSWALVSQISGITGIDWLVAFDLWEMECQMAPPPF